jgi:hypothetical protein
MAKRSSSSMVLRSSSAILAILALRTQRQMPAVRDMKAIRRYQLEFLKYLSSRNLAAIMMDTSSRRFADLDDRMGLEKLCCNLSR